MSTKNPDLVWQKVTDLLAVEESDAAPAGNPFKSAEMKGARQQLRKWVRVVDCIAVLLWAYVLLKASFDFDNALIRWLAPELRWIVDYRLLLALSLLAVMVIFVRKKNILWAVPYIVAFPIILVFWKLPRTLWRLGSWNLAFGIIHLLTSAMATFKSTILIGVGALVSIVAVIANWSVVSTIIGMVGLVLVYVAALLMTILRIFVPARFIRLQRDAILKIASKPGRGKRRNAAVAPGTMDTWTRTEATQFLTQTGLALISAQAVYFWAFRLEQYRKSLVAYILKPFIAFLLGLWTVVVLTVLTKGLFTVDADQFSYVDSPSGFTFLHYALNACFFGEVDALKPRGDWAFAFHSASSILMSGIILSVIPAIIFTWRNQRSDQESDDAIHALKRRSSEMAETMDKEFGEDMDQLAGRLLAFNWGLQGVLAWLMRQLPPNWYKN